MTITRVGSNKKFSEGWIRAFGSKKKAQKSTASSKSASKKKKKRSRS